MSKACLMIFQKNAVRGKVKTRIAATEGEDLALEIYKWLCAHTHQVAKEIKVDKFLFFSDFIPENSAADYPGYHLMLQSGDDLGERMCNAFRCLFSKGYSSVVIIGTDCPELQVSDLHSAFLALSRHDLVIGPARDGGYYLLGMGRFCPELFGGIPWSTPRVLELTLDAADQAGMDYEFLNIHSDVDTFGDWQDFSLGRKAP